MRRSLLLGLVFVFLLVGRVSAAKPLVVYADHWRYDLQEQFVGGTIVVPGTGDMVSVWRCADGCEDPESTGLPVLFQGYEGGEFVVPAVNPSYPYLLFMTDAVVDVTVSVSGCAYDAPVGASSESGIFKGLSLSFSISRLTDVLSGFLSVPLVVPVSMASLGVALVGLAAHFLKWV